MGRDAIGRRRDAIRVIAGAVRTAVRRVGSRPIHPIDGRELASIGPRT
jgi:hypothetical protein